LSVNGYFLSKGVPMNGKRDANQRAIAQHGRSKAKERGPHLLDVRGRRDRVRLSDVVVADVHGHLPPSRNRDQRLDACSKNQQRRDMRSSQAVRTKQAAAVRHRAEEPGEPHAYKNISRRCEAGRCGAGRGRVRGARAGRAGGCAGGKGTTLAARATRRARGARRLPRTDRAVRG
jgi:hypothetical protein